MELAHKYKELSKHYERKSNEYLQLIKEINGGEQLAVILPVIIDNQIAEINDINEKHKKIIEDLKEEYEKKIKLVEEERNILKWRFVEEFLSEEEEYSDEEEDYDL
tara:strand:- start:5 stop:322 length:318 start_codon:yes stop_codon:yes gene_type:complete